MEVRKSIVLLIDSDNFSNKYLKVLFDELNELGDVAVARAYGNFEAKVKNEFNEYGINPILQLPYTNGKNATDIRLVIEAIDLLNKKMFDCFCIATSDSDFTPLAMRLKEEKIFIIGAGEEKTPSPFKKICHKFISVDYLLGSTITKDDNSKGKEITKIDRENKLRELIKIVNGIIDTEHDEKGYAQFSRVIERIQKDITDFNPKNYGASNKQVLTFFKEFLSKNFVINNFNESNTHYIKKIQK